MKVRVVAFLLLLSLSLCCTVIPQYNKLVAVNTNVQISTSVLPRILIDAGHGGIDGGTSGADGTKEKDLNLAIAGYLQQYLTVYGFDTEMTRHEDDLISDPSLPTIRKRKNSDLMLRTNMANEENTVTVSIHQNFYEESIYDGAQVFYGIKHLESKGLALSLQNAIKNLLQPDNQRKIKPSTSDVYLLHNVTQPIVMVECGFLSNIDELQKLNDPLYQQQMAFAIATGLLKYYSRE